jgi:hypothetical protein
LAEQPTYAGKAPARRFGEPVRRRLICSVLCASALTAGGLTIGALAARATAARVARTLTLSETGHLRLTSKHAFTLNEQGSASGTITGTIYIHLHIANNQGDVTAEVNIYPHGGSLSGYGSASYEVDGADATFTGKLAITRGSGSFAGAHASSLQFSGDIARRTDAVAVKLSGQLSV